MSTNASTTGNPAFSAGDGLNSPSQLQAPLQPHQPDHHSQSGYPSQTERLSNEVAPALPSPARTSPPPLTLNGGAPRKDLRAAATAPPLMVPETDFHHHGSNEEVDPPFRTPTVWQEPHDVRPRSRQWNWSERSTAAFLGFAAGVLIVVPAVFILGANVERSGSEPYAVATTEAGTANVDSTANASPAPINDRGVWLDSRSDADARPITKPVAVKTKSETTSSQTPEQPAQTARFAVASTIMSPSTQPASQPAARRTPEPTTARPGPPPSFASNTKLDPAIEKALTEGRITDAREALRTAASPDSPDLWFILAETYDPLIARDAPASGSSTSPAQSRDLKSADVKFARYYYQRALTYGIAAAAPRLDALQDYR